MLRIFLFFFLLTLSFKGFSQDLYFPPLIGDEWEITEASSLGWCEEEVENMYAFLEENNSKAFLLLKDGKIVLEKYFGEFNQDSLWYWASAGKSFTSFLVGLGKDQEFISLDNPSSDYLGESWTSCNSEQEKQIKVKHQLSMSTGLDDRILNPNCHDPECLTYLAEPGLRWAYHNGPYTLLIKLIENSVGKNVNEYILSTITPFTGIAAAYLDVSYNRILVSKPRSMARFGLLMLNEGKWKNKEILKDKNYFASMINTSQQLNKSYGYLWWLNGKESFMVPGLQNVFSGPIVPNAPSDMYSAMGKNGQILNIVPSENIIMIRMGNAPELNGLVSMEFNRELWDYFNKVRCSTETSNSSTLHSIKLLPNPAKSQFSIALPKGKSYDIDIFSANGLKVKSIKDRNGNSMINMEDYAPGIYHIRITNETGNSIFKKVVKL